MIYAYIYIYTRVYMCIYIYIYIYRYTCTYITYVISPPLIITPPNKTPLWGDLFYYYQFRRRHDYPSHK